MNAPTSFTSYCKSYNLGHRVLEGFFDEPVMVEEKIDGSQFSFCRTEADEVLVRSRGRVFDVYGPDRMFEKACETVLSLRSQLMPGWTYRGEYLQRPRHNTLAYDRVPEKYIILFDVAFDDCKYLEYDELTQEAARLGLEVVPLLGRNVSVSSAEHVKELLSLESVLGRETIEGVVFKRRHAPFFNGRDQLVLAKYVSERFKERHEDTFQKEPSSKKDLVQSLADELRTEARWEKAVQHLAESGQLLGEAKDIGSLIKEVQRDTFEDHADEIKDRLFKAVRRQLERAVTRGLPEWYKERLLESQFGGGQ